MSRSFEEGEALTDFMSELSLLADKAYSDLTEVLEVGWCVISL